MIYIIYFENVNQEKKWNHAGEITRTTIALFRTDYETIPETSKLFFINVPVKQDGVWVFPVGLEDGLWFVYQYKSPEIYRINTPNEAKNIPVASGAANYTFSFDKSGNISLVK